MGEFARDYIIEHGSIKSPGEQLSIVRGQKEKETGSEDKAAGERLPFLQGKDDTGLG